VLEQGIDHGVFELRFPASRHNVRIGIHARSAALDPHVVGYYLTGLFAQLAVQTGGDICTKEILRPARVGHGENLAMKYSWVEVLLALPGQMSLVVRKTSVSASMV